MPKSQYIYSDPTIDTSAKGDTPYSIYDNDAAEVKYIKRSFVRIMIRNVLAFNQHYKQRKIIHKMYKILINNGLDTSISSFITINDRLIRTNLLEVSFLVNNFNLPNNSRSKLK